jgi:hypothetical protein
VSGWGDDVIHRPHVRVARTREHWLNEVIGSLVRADHQSVGGDLRQTKLPHQRKIEPSPTRGAGVLGCLSQAPIRKELEFQARPAWPGLEATQAPGGCRYSCARGCHVQRRNQAFQSNAYVFVMDQCRTGLLLFCVLNGLLNLPTPTLTATRAPRGSAATSLVPLA